MLCLHSFLIHSHHSHPSRVTPGGAVLRDVRGREVRSLHPFHSPSATITLDLAAHTFSYNLVESSHIISHLVESRLVRSWTQIIIFGSILTEAKQVKFIKIFAIDGRHLKKALRLRSYPDRGSGLKKLKIILGKLRKRKEHTYIT